MFVALLLVSGQVSAASTGICFLDAVIGLFDSIASGVSGILNPTTSTSSTTTTSSSSTTTSSTTSTTLLLTSTTSTSSTLLTTTTTVYQGQCYSTDDCPAAETIYKCNRDGNVERVTEIPFCDRPGEQDSICKARALTPKIEDICQDYEKCVDGEPQCVEIPPE